MGIVLCGFPLKYGFIMVTQAAGKEAQKKEESKKLKKQEKAKQKKTGKAGETADSAEGAPRKQQQHGGKRSKVTSKQQSGHVFFESDSDEEGQSLLLRNHEVKLACTLYMYM